LASNSQIFASRSFNQPSVGPQAAQRGERLATFIRENDIKELQAKEPCHEYIYSPNSPGWSQLQD
jgi:hypothetical protein